DHEYRYDPHLRTIHAAIQDGSFGEIVVGSFTYAAFRGAEYYAAAGGWRADRGLNGGGVLMNQAIHLIDLMQWFCGRPRRLFALTGKDHHSISVEDTAACLYYFGDGS